MRVMDFRFRLRLNVVWQRKLPADFGGRAPTWSFRESPLVDGEKVICTPGVWRGRRVGAPDEKGKWRVRRRGGLVLQVDGKSSRRRNSPRRRFARSQRRQRRRLPRWSRFQDG